MAKTPLLHISSDLMLGGAVVAAAEQAGLEHHRALSWARGESLASSLNPGVVLLDLELPGVDFAAVVAGCRSHVLAAYGSHVKVPLFDAARAVGVPVLLTRGQVHARGGEIVSQLAGQVATAGSE